MVDDDAHQTVAQFFISVIEGYLPGGFGIDHVGIGAEIPFGGEILFEKLFSPPNGIFGVVEK